MAYLYELQAERAKAKAFEDSIFGSTRNVVGLDVEPDKRDHIALMNSMSHTYGNALAFIQNWIINIFPKNLFKTIHVNSKIAHRQIRSTPHEYVKKLKPMIVFRPRIPSLQEERFLKNTVLTERMYDTYGEGALFDFFYDNNKKFSIKYQLNRLVMYVDVSLYFATLMQQLNYYHYIENATRIEHPFKLETFFESYLSHDLISTISKVSGIPIADDMGNTKRFVDYMNQNSSYPITYKLQGASKTREFYRYYPVSIETVISDLEKDDGERVGNTYDQYQINFTVRMEFFTNGFYLVYANDMYDLKLPVVEDDGDNLIPVFTDIYMKEDLILPPGWALFNQASYRLEHEYDSVNLKQMFNASILDVLDYHNRNGLPLIDFLDIKIRKQGEIIHEGKDYILDWENLELHFQDQNTYYTYHINVYVNIEYINNLLKTIYKLE